MTFKCFFAPSFSLLQNTCSLKLQIVVLVIIADLALGMECALRDIFFWQVGSIFL